MKDEHNEELDSVLNKNKIIAYQPSGVFQIGYLKLGVEESNEKKEGKKFLLVGFILMIKLILGYLLKIYYLIL